MAGGERGGGKVCKVRNHIMESFMDYSKNFCPKSYGILSRGES